jgi:hypothetical protein
VRTIRIWLLVLLAVLLPVRGAVAVAMLCPAASAGGQGSLAAATASAGMDHHVVDAAHQGEHEHADPQHAGHDSGTSGSGHHADGFGKCNLCCDFCSMTPLLSTLPTIPTPQHLSSVSFPDLFAPAPSFLSDGQERPPRSI